MALSKAQTDAIEELSTAYAERASGSYHYDRSYYKQSMADWLKSNATALNPATKRAAIAQMHGWFNYIPDTRMSRDEKIRLTEVIFGMPISRCSGCSSLAATERMILEGSRQYCRVCRPGDKSSCEPNGAVDFEFPALPFKEQIVKADTQFTVEMPGGEITGDGLAAIREHIYSRTVGLDIPELANGALAMNPMWQTKEGNFTKRLSKLILETRHVKLDEKLIADIGNIAKRYTAESRPWKLEFTRRINGRNAADFAHSGSCWWSSYWTSRCRFKQAGGIALRSFNPELKHPTRPTGRVWIVPVSSTTTTAHRSWRSHPELPASGYVMFNAYGSELFPFARVVAHLTGKSYRGVDLSGGGMYINNGRGVLVAAQSDLDRTNYIEFPSNLTCDCRENGDGDL